MSSQERINGGKISYVEVLKKMKFDLKQNIISCGLVTSLKDITLMHIAINFWQHGILDDVKYYLYSLKTSSKRDLYFEAFLDKFNNDVIIMTTKLIIPQLLKERLELMVTMIKEEIGIFYSHFFLYTLRSWDKIEKIIIYWDHLCWTQEGKINMIKTVESIVEDSKISTIDKYILACNNCLIDKIPDLLEKLPNYFTTEMLEEENSNNFKQYRLVLFWTFYFRRESDRFVQLINGNGVSTFEYLIKWTIYYQKKPALQYLWENLADETMKQNVADLIEYSYDSNNVPSGQNDLLYLFSQINIIKFNDLMSVKTSYCLVETLNRISKYYNIDLVPCYVFDFINTNDYYESLCLVSDCWYERFVDLKSYIRIWEIFELQFKNNLNEDLEKAFDVIVDPLECKSTLDLYPVRLLIDKRTFQQKADILSKDQGVIFCLEFIRGKLNIFEQFLKDVIDSEEKISILKSTLFANSKFDKFCLNLALENNLECLEEILITFCTNDLLHYKSYIPRKNNAFVINKMLTDCKDADLLNSLDKLISWCCEENEDEINKCKLILFDLETDLYTTNKRIFFDRIEELIKKNEWELVENYWKWIFSATEEQIMTPANKLIRIKEILYFGSRQKFCEFLEIFISLCFTQNEICELKEELKFNNILFTFVRDMLQLDDEKYSKIDDLLDWCYSSNKDEIDIFKNKFISFYKIEL